MTEIVIANPGSDLPFPKSLPEFMRLFRPTTARCSRAGALLEGRRAIMVEMDPEIAQTAIRRCEEIDG